MTRPVVMDKLRLAAFVDGELSPEEAAAVVIHLAEHPQDQAYVDDLAAANAALAAAFAAPLSEPVPPAIADAIFGRAPQDRVMPFRRKPASLVGGGIAAGAALAAGLSVLVFLPQTGAGDLVPGPLATDSALHRVLASLPSGEVMTLDDGTTMTVLASLPTQTGFCREVEVIGAATGRFDAVLACREGAGWSVKVVITETLEDAESADGFGTASGAEAQSFAPFLDRIGAGQVLTPDQEAAAIATGWRE